MSFQVNGITFYEPGDFSLITVPSSIQGVMGYNGNTMYRVEKSVFALASQGVPTSWFSFVDGGTNKYLNFTQSANVGYIGFYSTNGLYLYFRGPTATSPNSCGIYGPAGGVFQATAAGMGLVGAGVAGGYGLNLPDDVQKKARAYSWNLYASDKRDKTDIKAIKDADKVLKKVTGITYTDKSGNPRVGVTAQDLEATNIPEIVDKNEVGEYIGINPLLLLYPLLEEVKLLRSQVNGLLGSGGI